MTGAAEGASIRVVTLNLLPLPPRRGEGLAVYWCGDSVCVAAYSPEQALELALARVGALSGRGEVWLASATHLDREWQSLDGQPLGTLRALLGSMREPGCIIAPGYNGLLARVE